MHDSALNKKLLTLKWLALISPEIITPESNIQVTAIKEMNKEALDYWTNSPYQHLSKCIENSMENMHTNAGLGVKVYLQD